MDYPTYRYNHSGRSVRVESEAEDRALGEGWFDHPPAEGEIDERFSFAGKDDVDDMIDEETSADDGKKKKKKK